MPQPLGSQRVRHSLATAQKQTLPRLEVFFSLGTAYVCHTTNPSVGPGGQKKLMHLFCILTISFIGIYSRVIKT